MKEKLHAVSGLSYYLKSKQMRLRFVKHATRKGIKAIVCPVDLKILMGGMPDCQEENWEFKKEGC